MLDEDQQTAFDLAKDGHNLVVIGRRRSVLTNSKVDAFLLI
jgi:short-subunit dehydrogenase